MWPILGDCVPGEACVQHWSVSEVPGLTASIGSPSMRWLRVSRLVQVSLETLEAQVLAQKVVLPVSVDHRMD